MVLDRRAAHRQARAATEQPGGLGGLAVGVLDRLRLVEDQVVELDLAQHRHVPAQRAVGGEDHVPAGERVPLHVLHTAADAGMIEDAQRGGEPRRLGEPVEDQGARDDEQRGGQPLGGAPLPTRLEEREELDRLAEPHVVGQAAAEAEVLEEAEPAEPGPLIGAELALETRWRRGGGDPREAAQALPGLREGLVARRRGLAGEPGVEEGGLGGPELQVVPLRLSEPGERREPLEPLLGEDPEAAIPQGHEAFAAAQGGEEGRQGDRRPLELRLPVELEPVDP